ncbi:major facilitator superfamily domain-containing protein 6-like protein B [Stylophora pistillata]|uniref:major facilitator superfamily domain-containing protein 6-like protein B n=1 Tax=Stylophora pistillata TaxID=50429 RepID=UPI000C053F5A|nr:major facilitator superfamily domain-containing protein 6-like protein B [Stylophora pistillata]
MELQGFQRKKKPSLINRSVLPTKLINLFLSAGEANLLPFLPMFYRFIGLTALQNGVLGSARHLVSFWASPLLRIIAEKTNKRKFLFLVLLLASVISNISLGLISTPVSTTNFRAYNCENLELNHSISRVNGSDMNHLNASTKKSSGISTTGAINDSLATLFPNQRLAAMGNFTPLNDNTSTINKRFDIGLRKIKRSDSTNNGNILSLPGLPPLAPQVNNSAGTHNKSQTDYLNYQVQSEWYGLYGFRMDYTFNVLFILVLLSELFMSSMKAIIGSLFFDLNRQNKITRFAYNFWTSLGTVLGGGVLIMVIGYYRCDFGLINSFYLHFYIFAIFGTVSFALAALLKEQEQKSILVLRFARTCGYLCCDVNMICFLAVLLVLGIAESLMYNFMMWYLQDIGASIVVMGIILVASAFSEIPTQYISTHLIRCFGHHWVIFVSLF